MSIRLLFCALLALLAAVLAGHFISDDPGFIVIGYGGRVIRTTFAFFVLSGLLAMIVLYYLLRLLANAFALRRHWRRWSGDYRRRRAHRSLASGMLAFAAGDFARAERLFSRGVADDSQPEVHYLAAAEAAQAMNAPARRDNYLRLAHDVQPEAGAAFDLQRAAWLIENEQWLEARELLERLAAGGLNSPQLLRLRMQVLLHLGAARELQQLIPALRRERVVTADEADGLERHCAISLLRTEPASLEELRAIWEGMSRSAQAAPAVTAAYVRALIRAGAHDHAETVLRKRLERNWDSDLAALYGDIACDPPSRQLRKVDAWAAVHGDDAGLRLARARLAMRSGLWGQARTQLEQLLAAAPSPLLHRLLAEVAEGIGDEEAARRHRKRGLELATQEAPP